MKHIGMKRIGVIISSLFIALSAPPQMAEAQSEQRAGARVSNTQSTRMQGGFGVQDSTSAYNRVHNRANRPNQGFVRQPTTRNYGAQSYNQNYYNNNYGNYGGYGYGANIGGNGSGIYVGSGYPGGYDPYANYNRNYYSGGNWRDRDGYRWGQDRDRDAFRQHHRGPGWEKHWEHHRKSMRGDR